MHSVSTIRPFAAHYTIRLVYLPVHCRQPLQHTVSTIGGSLCSTLASPPYGWPLLTGLQVYVIGHHTSHPIFASVSPGWGLYQLRPLSRSSHFQNSVSHADPLRPLRKDFKTSTGARSTPVSQSHKSQAAKVLLVCPNCLPKLTNSPDAMINMLISLRLNVRMSPSWATSWPVLHNNNCAMDLAAKQKPAVS